MTGRLSSPGYDSLVCEHLRLHRVNANRILDPRLHHDHIRYAGSTLRRWEAYSFPGSKQCHCRHQDNLDDSAILYLQRLFRENFYCFPPHATYEPQQSPGTHIMLHDCDTPAHQPSLHYYYFCSVYACLAALARTTSKSILLGSSRPTRRWLRAGRYVLTSIVVYEVS